MNRKLKLKWIKALRSGRYKQATSSLRQEGAYCCLGVLANVAGCRWLADEPILKGKAVGLRSDEGAYLSPVQFDISSRTQKKLAEFNDDGKTFDEIADYIEKRIG